MYWYISHHCCLDTFDGPGGILATGAQNSINLQSRKTCFNFPNVKKTLAGRLPTRSFQSPTVSYSNRGRYVVKGLGTCTVLIMLPRLPACGVDRNFQNVKKNAEFDEFCESQHATQSHIHVCYLSLFPEIDIFLFDFNPPCDFCLKPRFLHSQIFYKRPVKSGCMGYLHTR